MNNFKELLTAQKEALERDINQYIEKIKELELTLEGLKDSKAEANRVLKSIEKKPAK